MTYKMMYLHNSRKLIFLQRESLENMDYANVLTYRHGLYLRQGKKVPKRGANVSESMLELWVPMNRSVGLRRWWQTPELVLGWEAVLMRPATEFTASYLSDIEFSHVSCDMTLLLTCLAFWTEYCFAKVHLKSKAWKVSTFHGCNFQLFDCPCYHQLLTLLGLLPLMWSLQKPVLPISYNNFC